MLEAADEELPSEGDKRERDSDSDADGYSDAPILKRRRFALPASYLTSVDTDLFGDDDDDDDDDPAPPESDDDGCGAGRDPDDFDHDDDPDPILDPEPAHVQEPGQAETRVIDVRPFSVESLNPPRIVVKMGKTPASSVTMILSGDLVRHLSSPLFKFRLRVSSEDEAADDAPLFVEEVVKVLEGPCVTAAKIANEIATARNLPEVPKPDIAVTIGALNRAILKSGYFGNVRARSPYISKTLAEISASIPGVTSAPSRVRVSAAILERHAPTRGDSALAWAVRNIYEPVAFFERMNAVGGYGAKALENEPAGTWNLVFGLPGGLVDDPAIDEPAIVEMLEKVHFAGVLGTWRRDRLHSHLALDVTSTLRDSADIIVKASEVMHRLPVRTSAATLTPNEALTGGVVWGDTGDVWPQKMRTMLAEKGVFTQQRDGQRWFACWNDTREYFTGVSTAISRGITFIRAEADDDADAVDRGYIHRVFGIGQSTEGKTQLITSGEGRARYLGARTEVCSTRLSQVSVRGGNLGEDDVVVIDRAHQISGDALVTLVRDLTGRVKHVYVCGSLWASATRGTVSMFAQLYDQAEEAKREVCTRMLDGSRVAEGRSPISEKSAVPSGAVIFALRHTSGANEDAIPEALRSAFPCTPIVTPHAHARNTGWRINAAAIVVLSPGWTREDLAIVWQCTPNAANAVWFVGEKNPGDWRHILETSARKGGGMASSALLRH